MNGAVQIVEPAERTDRRIRTDHRRTGGDTFLNVWKYYAKR